MICVVDYGAGNLHSVCNALDLFGHDYQVGDKPEHLEGAGRILLPGVGHFGQMLTSLASTGINAELKNAAARGVPLLGICLGMQALFESSEEAPGVRGLGLLSGEIKRFTDVPRVPHMGWNDVCTSLLLAGWFVPGGGRVGEGGSGSLDLAQRSGTATPSPSSSEAQTSSQEEGNRIETYYFANSFYAPVGEWTTGVCEYGTSFSAIVRKDNVAGFQFHPEKSGEAGLRLLRNWCEAC